MIGASSEIDGITSRTGGSGFIVGVGSGVGGSVGVTVGEGVGLERISGVGTGVSSLAGRAVSNGRTPTVLVTLIGVCVEAATGVLVGVRDGL